MGGQELLTRLFYLLIHPIINRVIYKIVSSQSLNKTEKSQWSGLEDSFDDGVAVFFCIWYFA